MAVNNDDFLPRWNANCGAVLVSRDQCDRWVEDPELRQEVVRLFDIAGVRLAAVTTINGAIVDVWTPQGWQSGLSA